MNNRFKFRGYWYNDCLKEWRVYDNPQFITGDGTDEIWYDTEGGAYPELPPDAELHLCQCTGLKDKNGKLIYEGDIVKSSRGISRVVFDDTEACFGVSNFLSVTPFAVLLNQEWKVIGNIYENKELLND